jgi:hypothetical protein
MTTIYSLPYHVESLRKRGLDKGDENIYSQSYRRAQKLRWDKPASQQGEEWFKSCANTR